MALSALIHKSKTVPVATLTVATIATHYAKTPATVAKVASVTVANPQKFKNAPLLIADRKKLLAYLGAMGETDKASIDEYLTECENNPETLARELQHADDCSKIKSGDDTGLVRCSFCRQLFGDTCQFYGWRVVVDNWRRCGDFEAFQKATASELITCKSCRNFQSYNAHGSGAGNCSANVQPFGACWWADTAHDCGQYLIKAEV